MIFLNQPIPIKKKCSCGICHDLVPIGAKPQIVNGITVGWVWQCSCKSHLTHFILPSEEVLRLARAEAA